MTTRLTWRTRWKATHASLAALVTAAGMSGCMVAPLIGGMAESAHRAGSTNVPAQYRGLQGKSFAVVVIADRSVQADFPGIVPTLMERITARLADPANGVGATHYVPASQALPFLNSDPTWTAWEPSRLMAELGVDRLIRVELIEYRVREPGNPYQWNGLGWGALTVYEADSNNPDFEVFRREIRVQFPDSEGQGVHGVSGTLVASALVKRFVDRATWLFYDHKEPNVITY